VLRAPKEEKTKAKRRGRQDHFFTGQAVFTCILREFFTRAVAVQLRIRIYSISFCLARRVQ
jgi:hypothetical protein